MHRIISCGWGRGSLGLRNDSPLPLPRDLSSPGRRGGDHDEQTYNFGHRISEAALGRGVVNFGSIATRQNLVWIF